MSFVRVTLAELTKLRTLPAVPFIALGCVIVGAAITGALAYSASGSGPAAADAVLAAVPFLGACVSLLGVLPVAHEREGSQLRTSLTAVPNRLAYVAGKSVAAAALVTAVAALTIGASLAAAILVQRFGLLAPLPQQAAPGALAGAACYLALIGMLAHAIALLCGRLVPALVAVLSLTLIVPPLLSASEHARWLPSRAGELLYSAAGDAALGAGTGALVLAAWIVGIAASGTVALCTRDQ